MSRSNGHDSDHDSPQDGYRSYLGLDRDLELDNWADAPVEDPFAATSQGWPAAAGEGRHALPEQPPAGPDGGLEEDLSEDELAAIEAELDAEERALAQRHDTGTDLFAGLDADVSYLARPASGADPARWGEGDAPTESFVLDLRERSTDWTSTAVAEADRGAGEPTGSHRAQEPADEPPPPTRGSETDAQPTWADPAAGRPTWTGVAPAAAQPTWDDPAAGRPTGDEPAPAPTGRDAGGTPDPQTMPMAAERLQRQERAGHTAAPAWDLPPAPSGPGLTGADSLTADTVLKRRRQRPQSGWRKGVYSVTGGKVNLGLSAADRRRAEQLDRIRTKVVDCHRVAVISLKGGVGKTTTTAALGAMFASTRGDRVIAVDANPDRGTLGERVPRESGATVRHMLEARDRIDRYADVRAFTSQSPTRLEVLASDSDPSASLAYSEQDYRDTVSTLERFYNLILTDCGTGLLHSAMHGILGLASSLVVVSSPSLDGARSASATLDWLEAHGMGDLAANAVVVISSVRPGGGMVDVLQLEDHFAARCREVVSIPYDRHLETGGVLDLAELDENTQQAYLELAAAVGSGFAARP
jgi:MinD-like ATPase involved in chromosome partitioning or flagellar assembly